ncbi:MAG TPA: diguanylate cyclase, partial [Gammaproteobacteria bacterium]|nr:diguanylate cyclase [Gammaproteobacteria bacterium]
MAHHEPPASGGQDPEAEARFLRRILDSLDHPFYVVDVRDYTIRFANDATSCHGPLLPGRSTCYALTHNRDTPCTGDHPCPLEEVQWTGKPAVVEHTHYDHQGRPLPVEVHGHPIFDEEGNLAFMAEYSLDLSARKQLEADLRQVAQVFRHSGEGILIAGPDGRIQRVNPAFSRITGYSEEEVMGRTPGEVLGSGWQDRAFYRRFWQELRERGTWQGEIWNRRRSGEIYPEWLTASTVRDDQNGIQAYLGIFSDITQKKREESRLQRLAYYDPLTGLPNRATFKDRLEQAIARATRHDAALALLFVDLDGFKEVNDHWGHQAGDAVLQEVGHRLRSLVRKTDTVARLGGDEFTVLLEETDTCRADGVAEKVIIALNAPIPIGAGNSVTLGCSVGIVGCWMGEVLEAHAEHLLDYADQAMYQAKMAGKNTYRAFPEPAPEERASPTPGSLPTALERGELELFFQPEVDLELDRVTGLEALL